MGKERSYLNTFVDEIVHGYGKQRGNFSWKEMKSH